MKTIYEKISSHFKRKRQKIKLVQEQEIEPVEYQVIVKYKDEKEIWEIDRRDINKFTIEDILTIPDTRLIKPKEAWFTVKDNIRKASLEINVFPKLYHVSTFEFIKKYTSGNSGRVRVFTSNGLVYGGWEELEYPYNSFFCDLDTVDPWKDKMILELYDDAMENCGYLLDDPFIKRCFDRDKILQPKKVKEISL